MNNITKQNYAPDFRFTDEEMETAKRTDLPDLLEHLGYTVRRLGSRYHTTREMDSVQAVLVEQAGVDEAPDHLGGDTSLLKIGKYPAMIPVGDGQGENGLFLTPTCGRTRT